ncbi:MAG: hypothetical protein ACRDF0_10595, partial [Candidatus Limnocylindria bacterium]
MAALGAAVIWRSAAQPWIGQNASDDLVVTTLRLGVPLALVAASALALAIGRLTSRPARWLAYDALSALGLLFALL